MSDTFQHETLDEVSHSDPDKHFIGESLPSPSLAETKYAGVATATGTSPFPARADHSHDTRTVFGVFNRSPTQTIAAGAIAYINGINWNNVGDDLRFSGSTQLFEFPQEGEYSIHMLAIITRSAGTWPAVAPLPAYRVSFDYDNATTSIVICESTLPGNRGRIVDTFIDRTWILNFGTIQNVQFKYQNFDTVDHFFGITRLHITRMNSLVNP